MKEFVFLVQMDESGGLYAGEVRNESTDLYSGDAFGSVSRDGHLFAVPDNNRRTAVDGRNGNSYLPADCGTKRVDNRI